MIEIYHARGTRAYRVIWVCEELGVPYKVVPVDFSAEYRASPEWRALNPVGKVPAMRDDGFTMFESGAMVQYVVDRYGEGRLQPRPGTRDHAHYLQWCWFAESTFARPCGEIVAHRRAFGDATVPAVLDEMAGRARTCAEALDQALEGRDYLLGQEFTAADAMMAYTVLIYRKLVTEDLPRHVAGYWLRLTERPAYAATEAADRLGQAPAPGPRDP